MVNIPVAQDRLFICSTAGHLNSSSIRHVVFINKQTCVFYEQRFPLNPETSFSNRTWNWMTIPHGNKTNKFNSADPHCDIYSCTYTEHQHSQINFLWLTLTAPKIYLVTPCGKQHHFFCFLHATLWHVIASFLHTPTLSLHTLPGVFMAAVTMRWNATLSSLIEKITHKDCATWKTP